ncbi:MULTISPECIES: chemotaxis-specific protein-glutamate methyltransferase CheB [Marichromatium]|uniref:Protein-glutamate methylesterase/protein-glutamine glutaminase n=1 Tax=Marichromatium gracile TaxID=1048 RepID=A0A4R4AJR5_MARGR|nr:MULTISPECIES: chemotaxis-specific protein-glutamate methyltransferase CheB [Marichromatium]MBK1710433.1 chemotaxis response regulator protein-glutamate methylesterase [Marichromatium gracile]RNE92249.1 chemotaxis-specific protein-glutamate methyltransferase CheB [Marichromatium sp. AB31]RNE92650.1 chemotaxis-specific protein-glutamate methyltransferase CheB [Marichromatium sp. AB32]TCW39623.1 two-component system chemotaxis response regulator CheB [Marichromatium gracile]
MIKLLIVDDSALMRRQLKALFLAEGDFEIRVARNGQEAVAENIDFAPDVVTLDINMPEMDGLTALSLLMAERPVPVVMVSSLTEKGAIATFEALNLGAVDYIPKPGGTISLSMVEIESEIVAKVRAAARARIRTARGLAARIRGDTPSRPQRPRTEPTRAAPDDTPASGSGVVVIGVSTGGPRTLEDILPRLPADFPWPVLVAQHMPPSFTLPFAERMNLLCQLAVSEVNRPTAVAAGNIYIGKGGADMILARRGGRLTALARPEDPTKLWHPSVELLGRSMLEHCDPTRVIAVMLTGMGHDGAQAFTELKQRGARTIAESEESAVVFGMPAELISRGGASLVLPVERIADQLQIWVER